MSLVEQYHAEHKARLRRLGAPPKHQAPAQKAVAPKQMWDAPSSPSTETALVVRSRREYHSNDRPSAFVPTARRILRAVSFEFNVSIEDITGPSRLQEFAVPRFVAIGLAVELTRISFPAMGQWLGNRDHSSIFNGKKRILSLLESEAFRNRFDQIKAGITA